MQRENLEQTEFDWTHGRFPPAVKMLICIAAVLLILMLVFRVRTFEITGSTHYTEQQVIEASGISQGDILMGINKTSVAAKLLTKLPYLEEIVIAKELPGTIRITVTECTAGAAAWSDYATCWLLSSNGKLLEEIDEDDLETLGLPVLTGAELTLPTKGEAAAFTDEAKGVALLEVLSAVNSCGLASAIKSIDATDASSIQLDYMGTLVLGLGDGSRAEYKLRYFLGVQDQLPQNASGVLDIGFTGAFEEQAVFHPYE